MTSTVTQIAAVVAGLAILATGLIAFPRSGLKGAGVAIAIALALAIAAADFLTAIHRFGT
jgi:hypothetical protein